MSNLGWTCPTCKTNWAPSVLKCDCGPKRVGDCLCAEPELATTRTTQNVWQQETIADFRQYGPGGTA
jgi:hypothetical protein